MSAPTASMLGVMILIMGGQGEEAMEHVSGQEAHHIDTHGGSGFLGWPWWDDHKYTDEEWNEIDQAVEDNKPVVAGTAGGGLQRSR